MKLLPFQMDVHLANGSGPFPLADHLELVPVEDDQYEPIADPIIIQFISKLQDYDFKSKHFK